jgi:hypothetical protein
MTFAVGGNAEVEARIAAHTEQAIDLFGQLGQLGLHLFGELGRSSLESHLALILGIPLGAP